MAQIWVQLRVSGYHQRFDLCPRFRPAPFERSKIEWNQTCPSAVILLGAMKRRRGYVFMDELPLILVAEDDLLIQGMVEEALSDGGFELVLAATGEEAVTLMQGDRTRHRALVTDINLQGKLDGWDVAKRARELNPDIPVIYITGTAAEEWTSKGVPNSILLAKPFAPAQLVTAVSNLLNIGSPPPT
jgi:CheY-like chemotaxis protein